jgi:hypothetical protein
MPVLITADLVLLGNSSETAMFTILMIAGLAVPLTTCPKLTQ